MDHKPIELMPLDFRWNICATKKLRLLLQSYCIRPKPIAVSVFAEPYQWIWWRKSSQKLSCPRGLPKCIGARSEQQNTFLKSLLKAGSIQKLSLRRISKLFYIWKSLRRWASRLQSASRTRSLRRPSCDQKVDQVMFHMFFRSDKELVGLKRCRLLFHGSTNKADLQIKSLKIKKNYQSIAQLRQIKNYHFKTRFRKSLTTHEINALW